MKKFTAVRYECEYDNTRWDDPVECQKHETDLIKVAFDNFISHEGHVAFGTYDNHNNKVLVASNITDSETFCKHIASAKFMYAFVDAFGDYGWNSLVQLFWACELAGYPVFSRVGGSNLRCNVTNLGYVNKRINEFTKDPDTDLWVLSTVDYEKEVQHDYAIYATFRGQWKHEDALMGENDA